MKLVIAVIRPERLEAVEQALLAALGVDRYRLTVHRVEGVGRAEGEVVESPGGPARELPARRIQITLGVHDTHLESALSAILNAARTGGGQPGDGKIFVLPLEDCLRIRTGERGDWAI